jgi:2-polyprenyl-3-methyl-5-hydroxy-6-metoxy-1,4-benzoquinol methylase
MVEEKIIKPGLQDFVSLILTFLAKINRTKLKNESDLSPEMSEFYEQFFLRKDLSGWKHDERKIIRRNTIVDFLSSQVRNSGTLLDVGCGFGEVLYGMPPKWRLYGMDYSHHNVKAARAILKERAIIKQGNLHEIPFENSSMDVCCCLEVLEHIKDDESGIKEINRVLKSGAILILSVPHTYYWPQYKSRIGHYRHYTRESLESLLKNNGFTIFAHLPNYPHWNLKYSRQYALTRMLCLTIGRLTNQHEVFEFTWPWAKEPRMVSVKRKLGPVFNSDRELDYGRTQFGTFIAAQKL